MAEYVLELPRWDSPDYRGRREVWNALHANQRGGRSAGPQRRQMEAYRARLVRAAIHAVATLALDARIPECDHLTVELVWVPDGPRRHRDEDNLWPLLKVFCDALARGPAKRSRGGPGLDLVPDDDRQHMAKLPPRIEDKANHAPGLWLYVTTREPAAV